ncbi:MULTISPECIES: MATE family efflux transporter [unclassified Sphingomonas]|uniref:MATE family efflux transporter n=1 Tax=unclassified Sphingomonas TaxID=196159 RepID=UPI001AD07B14|nr:MULTISPECIES: MATE family efflux transporter [unclassified Sphingomonas]MBN8846926.1 MATE family efflux transporter [Sphingomonas sp.]
MTILTRRVIFAQAWPIILGQALVPLVGVVDTTVIGRTGNAATLAGVALGVTTVNLIFWTFGFLRMGVTGLTAQTLGAGGGEELRALLLRALLLGLGLGIALLALSPAIVPLALSLMQVPASAAEAAHAFTTARFAGAPAALGFYVINGWLLGLGRTRLALACQVAFNGVNIALDVLLVAGFGLGAWGAGIGTSIAEWVALASGLWAARQVLGPGWWRIGRRATFAPGAFRRLLSVNADIMIRTVALLLLFTWFARAGARLGAVPLAANHVLMQFVSVSAFVLDGFAFTAEARVGAAIGAGSRAALLRAARLTGEFSLAGGLAFAAVIAAAGPWLIALVTHDPAVQRQALAMLPYCALVPLLGMPSWLLDGIFIGATRGRILRNAALVSLALYLATDTMLRGWGDIGVWIALLASYLYRAAALGVALPRLVRSVDAA